MERLHQKAKSMQENLKDLYCTNFLNKDFIILGRISKSKNIELAIDSFLNSKFKNNLITVVGDSVTTQDKEYKKFLENRYKNNDNHNTFTSRNLVIKVLDTGIDSMTGFRI